MRGERRRRGQTGCRDGRERRVVKTKRRVPDPGARRVRRRRERERRRPVVLSSRALFSIPVPVTVPVVPVPAPGRERDRDDRRSRRDGGLRRDVLGDGEECVVARHDVVEHAVVQLLDEVVRASREHLQQRTDLPKRLAGGRGAEVRLVARGAERRPQPQRRRVQREALKRGVRARRDAARAPPREHGRATQITHRLAHRGRSAPPETKHANAL